jgi:hypothetical protein
LKLALLYLLQILLAYQLMLAIMTYNVGVSIAVFSGAFLGHYLFNRYRLVRSATNTTPSSASLSSALH